MSNYNIVAQSEDSTVVYEYEPCTTQSNKYQSESEMETELIELLCGQGYEYLSVHNDKDLIPNIRKQLERLNHYQFTDSEWNKFYSECIACRSDGIKEKTRRIQEDYVQNLCRDDGSIKNIRLIDKSNVFNNKLQVIHQCAIGTEDGAKYDNRYDVTILVNGFPLVQIELKRRGIPIREAFNQIDRYQRDSFWASTGLFEYIQIFVISNGTNTKYYSNTTRFNHVEAISGNRTGKTNNGFEFTSFWADSKNKIIPDIVDFAKTFLTQHTLLNVLTKYCVFTSEQRLLVMRPYQITATEQILNRINISDSQKWYGSAKGGGYIWHTTGSGKTLTSFKTAQLATKIPYINKILFVVDRKDLDYQTMKEYDKFEKGAANSNSSTSVLKKQIEDSNVKIIITTIQKLAIFVKKNPVHNIYQQRVVIIFDECHRSQFGDMHKLIVKVFKKYNLFGFTGTPIFAVNSESKANPNQQTTEQTFGDRLHTYTIVDAINDKNVLPFRIAYIKTMSRDEAIIDEQIYDINRKKALLAPERVSLITKYILDNFDRMTYRGGEAVYSFNKTINITDVSSSHYKTEEIKEKRKLSGFNSIFAVDSIDAAKLYYSEFKKQIKEHPEKNLKFAVIYSYGVNEETNGDGIDEENSEDTNALDSLSRDFLDATIMDYNLMFQTAYDTSSDKFQNYYKDVSMRMKNKELDILIVVNMFLTGFDAPTLNTVWVDKNLKEHGLIQTFSRTNRILNSVKMYGNIVCFRNLQTRVDEALATYGDKDISGIVVMRPFSDYYKGYDDNEGEHHQGYTELISELLSKYPLSEPSITGEQNQKSFIGLFGSVLRMRNLLKSFDEFCTKEVDGKIIEGKEIISERDMQDYLGRYQDLKDSFVNITTQKDIVEDIIFETELVKQIDVGIDYILALVTKYHDSHCQDKDVLVSIHRAIRSSPQLRSKKDLIDTFLEGILDANDILADWRKFVIESKERELDKIIEEEQLNSEKTKEFVANAFLDEQIKEEGTDINNILPPMSGFGGARAKKKLRVFERLREFFDKYFGI